jgi:RimJ/RimL family protein N-acetyltransferase
MNQRERSADDHQSVARGELVNFRLELLGPPNEDLLTRLFVLNDVPEITRFFDPFPLDADSAHRIAHYEGSDKYWGIWLHDDLIGMMMVRGFHGENTQPTLGALIDRSVTSRGVGQAAFLAVVEELRLLGAPLVRANVHEDNVACLGAIRRTGWHELSRGDGRVLMERLIK